MGMEFRVDPRVLIPRPETEILVQAALEALWTEREGGAPRGSLVADIGCGSGAIGLSIARLRPDARVMLTDISAGALEVAMANASDLGVADKVRFFCGDLAEPLLAAGFAGQFDLVVSNPPYIPSEEMDDLPPEVRLFEPGVALDGGPGGLRVIQRLACEAAPLLKGGGRLFLEIGDDQAHACRETFERAGVWQDFRILLDYSGKQRVFSAGARKEREEGEA